MYHTYRYKPIKTFKIDLWSIPFLGHLMNAHHELSRTGNIALFQKVCKRSTLHTTWCHPLVYSPAITVANTGGAFKDIIFLLWSNFSFRTIQRLCSCYPKKINQICIKKTTNLFSLPRDTEPREVASTAARSVIRVNKSLQAQDICHRGRHLGRPGGASWFPLGGDQSRGHSGGTFCLLRALIPLGENKTLLGYPHF